MLRQWRSQPIILGGTNTSTLSKQQYFVWDTASQCTNQQDMLEIWEGMAPLALCSQVHSGPERGRLIEPMDQLIK